MSSQPSYLVKRLEKIKPSATLALVQVAADMRKAGRDVVGLHVGEPEFNVPESIQQAVIDAVKGGQNKYTPVPGRPELRQAVAKKFADENGIACAVDEVITATGGKQLLFNAFAATLNAGDEVIIPAPYWISYPEMVMLMDGKPVIVSCPESADFKMTPHQLQAAITPRTKWVIINSPSNPTGAVYTRAELVALGEVLRQHPHVLILSDDVYEYIVYDGQPFVTLAQLLPDMKDRILTVNSASKSFAMTGWRLGYAVGPKPLIAAMNLIQGQSTSNPNSLAQAAVLYALNNPKPYVADWVKTYQRRRDEMVARINSIAGLSVKPPAGAFYLYVNCSGIIGKTAPTGEVMVDDAAFCKYVLNAEAVTLVPGAEFGLSPYFRMTTATGDDRLSLAMDRLAKAVAALK